MGTQNERTRPTAEGNEIIHGENSFTSNGEPPATGSCGKGSSIADTPLDGTARINVPSSTTSSTTASTSSFFSLVSRVLKKLSYYQYRMDTYYLPPKRKLKVQIFVVGFFAVFNMVKFFQHLHDRPQNAFAFIFTTCVLLSCLYILYSVGYESLAEQYVAYYVAMGYKRESSGEGEERSAVMCSVAGDTRATAAESQGVGTSQHVNSNSYVRAHKLTGDDLSTMGNANSNGNSKSEDDGDAEEIDYEKFNITTNIDTIYRMLRAALTFRAVKDAAKGLPLPIISRSSKEGVPIVTRITLSSLTTSNDPAEGTSLSSTTEMVAKPYSADLTAGSSRSSGVGSADGRSVVDSTEWLATHIAEDMAESNPRHPSNSSLIRRYPDALMNISIGGFVFVAVMCLYYLYIAVTEGALSSTSSSDVDGGGGGGGDAPSIEQKLTLANFDASNYMVSALYFSCKKWFVAVYLYMKVVKKESVLVKEALLKLVADEEDAIESEKVHTDRNETTPL